jgi:two-component system nitrogen regulation response regulator GlnG
LNSENKTFNTTLEPPVKTDASSSRVPALTVISHPRPTRAGDRAFLIPLVKGNRVSISRNGPMFTAPGKVIGTALDDPFLSRSPFVLAPGLNGGVMLEPGVLRSRLRVNGDPASESHSFSREDLVKGVVLAISDRVVLLLHWAISHQQGERANHGLVGSSEGVIHLRREIERVADLPIPVLLRGESGTGKELVAGAIHRFAGQAELPFITVNMGAVPATLAAAELFGALKGSFTGAHRDQPGYFRQAHGGTLFLDEIGETPPEVQVMLLRALDTGEIFPVGAQKPVKVDVRVIAATDADLEAKIDDDSFKSPLFHRLSGYEIYLPPLRERREDLGRLFFHFARHEIGLLGLEHFPQGDETGDQPWLPAELAESLLEFSWPGNVRQLRNVVRQLVIGCRGEPVLHLVPKVA